MKSIIYTYQKSKETEELDFEVYDYLKLNDDDLEDLGHEIRMVPEDERYSSAGESNPIEIERLISQLKTFKKKGSTHVEMIHHGDHHSYIFNPVNIRLATDKEIKDAADTRRSIDIERKSNKIDQLKKELDKLEKELT